MKLHLPEVLKGSFARKRLAVPALMTAVVGAVALIVWRVHFVFEFLAAEVFFALLFLALLVIIGTFYLVGAAAASLTADSLFLRSSSASSVASVKQISSDESAR